MDAWVTEIMHSLGYLGIALLMFLENVFPPIPSEVIMPAAGFSAKQGEMSFAGVVAAGSAGALLGGILWYYLALWVGAERLRGWVARHGKWFGLKLSDIDRAEAWFHRHGRATVLFGRMVPGIRTLISIPAGLARMPFVSFVVYSLIGTIVWTIFLTFLGWWLRDQYHVVEKYIGPISTIVAVLLVVAAVVWIIRHRRQLREKPDSVELP